MQAPDRFSSLALTTKAEAEGETAPTPLPSGEAFGERSARYRFRGFLVDEALFEVRRAGVEIKLRRKSFEVLVYLIRNADRVVSKQELLESVWHRTAVCESSLANCVSEIRASLGDRSREGRLVQTVYGRGYRFVAPVEADEAAPDRAAASGPEGPSSPVAAARVFVGRRRELARLHRSLDDVLAGESRTALLLGESGIGKTRLLRRFLREAATRGATALFVRRSHDDTRELLPWIETFRRQLATGELSGGAELDREVASAEEKPSKASRARLFHTLREILGTLAHTKPCVVAVDDLQEADQASLLLLSFLARELQSERVLFVATLDAIPRAGERPLFRLAAELQREVGAELIELSPLGLQDVEEFLCAVRGKRPEPELVSAVHARTEGHPLFLREFVELLDSEGWPSEGSAPPIPPGVRAIVQLRFDRLGEACRRLLDVAAVGGREISASLLQRVAEADAGTCLDGLQRAVEASLVCEVSPLKHPGTYRFAHGLLREVLYEGIAAPERVELHRRFALELEARQADPGVVAQHFAKSSDPADLEKAFVHARRAGRRAAKREAYDRAAEHYDLALFALTQLAGRDPREKCDLLLAQASALRWSHQYSRAQEVLGQAIRCARASNAVDHLAAATIVWNGPDTAGALDHARIRLIEEALRGIPSEDSELRAHLLLGRIVARWSLDPPEQTLERAHEVIALADRRSYVRVQVPARWYLHAVLHARPEQIEERWAVREEALRIAIAQSERGAELLTRTVLLGDFVEIGDADALDREIQAIEGLVAGQEDAWPLLGSTGMRALLRGELEQAEDRLGRLWGDVLFWPSDVPCSPGFASQMFVLRREQGRLADLEPLVRAGRSQMPAIGLWHALSALLLWETGRPEEARQELARLGKAAESLPRNAFWLGSMACLADLVAGLEEADHARAFYEVLLPYRKQMAMLKSFACVGPVGLSLGRLATTLGWWSRAAEHFDEADELAHRLRAAPHAARIAQARETLRIRRDEAAEAARYY